MKKIISIIAPCYNESDNIEPFYQRLVKIFKEELSDYDYEIIVVDDNSTDSSSKILKKISDNDDSFKLIFNARNYGVHVSTFNAIKYVNGDALIPMLPVDMQDTPEIIIDFVKKWEEGFDIVYGIKKDREENFFLKCSRNIYYNLVTKISNVNIPPYVGEFQLLDKKIYQELLNFDDYYPYTRGIIATLSSNSFGIEYTWKKRLKGKSKTSILKLFDMAINGIISFSNLPIRVFTVFGVTLSLISLLFIIIQMLSHILIEGRMSTPGISTLIVAIFFFSGIQLLFMGIIGEYISAIHSQVRKSKNNVVEKEKINLN